MIYCQRGRCRILLGCLGWVFIIVEYAYGGHSVENVTGIYTTAPRTVPPGGRFRMCIRYGFITMTAEEIERVVLDVGKEFQGPSYNLLKRNCNHFTSHLLYRLTSLSTPKWLNRAAAIGVAFPYMVPNGWIEPPSVDDNEVTSELFESYSSTSSCWMSIVFASLSGIRNNVIVVFTVNILHHLKACVHAIWNLFVQFVHSFSGKNKTLVYKS
ncbi:hypothetical protein PORY_000617 [Pneumocystis oryctolagi]|uniref:Uncharacterized protein n=1 Tax=Pneumocystis oryctolagi TaxID=42067 RepID=A0ACB7CF44_9ASCO|nr:hypothetical protein PORY_000617 [Pneumocystis oryctolagi]